MRKSIRDAAYSRSKLYDQSRNRDAISIDKCVRKYNSAIFNNDRGIDGVKKRKWQITMIENIRVLNYF